MKISIASNIDEANKLIFVKDYEKAESLIGQVLETTEHREDYLVHLRRIELAEKLGKLGDLQEHARSHLALHPESMTHRIVSIWIDQFKHPEESSRAVEMLQDALRQFGPHPGIFYGIAMCMEVQENWDRALYNYEQCINLDPKWYPAYFGISQIYYHKSDDKKGDYYFHLYEEAAPYNVYGNFETHRRLANEYLQKEQFTYARTAITTLSEWWIENKGSCPPEIQIYEYMMLAKIADHQGSLDESMHYRNQALVIANRLLNDAFVAEGVLYFIAKTFEEFTELKQAFHFYKKILSQEVQSPEMVQKIGGQFLSFGEYKLAQDLFLEAYKYHPDNPEIRFCLLVANLKHAGVHVEEYLIGKERMKQLADTAGDKVEFLSLLHSLLAKYKDDPDVHANMGEVYLYLGNIERAGRHFKRMYELDQLSRVSALKYASFEMHHGDAQQAMAILETLGKERRLTRQELTEINWLKSTYFYRTGDFERAYHHLDKVKTFEPWNVSYLVHEVQVLTRMHVKDGDMTHDDSVMRKLARNDEENLDWDEYDQKTAQILKGHHYELAYAREKLHFLYGSGLDERLERLVQVSCQYDPSRGTHDFLRLLNTNFDSPRIYWALGMLCKEIWQLEAATMWFEQILHFPGSDRSDLGKAYLEVADCFVWRNQHLVKALEYVKLAMEMGERGGGRALTIMAHILLKTGQVRQAQVYLEDQNLKADAEATYLTGLVYYRNGAHQKANQVWKPLLTQRSDNVRFHHIKQEVLKYYFEKAPYRGVN